MHEPERRDEHHDEDRPAKHEGHGEARLRGDESSRDGTAEHRAARDDLTACEHRLDGACERRRGERVDEPCLDRAGEEGEAETDQDRDERPRPERRFDLPEADVEQGGHRQCHRAEQVRDPSPGGVGDDTGRHLEENHPGGEEGIGRERLEVREACVQQEDGVDSPDQRRCERVAEQKQEVGPLNRARGRHDSARYGSRPGSAHCGTS